MSDKLIEYVNAHCSKEMAKQIRDLKSLCDRQEYIIKGYRKELMDLSKDSVPLPKAPTNGSAFLTLFPTAIVTEHPADELVDAYVTVNIPGCDTVQDYSMEWWTSPYEVIING